MSQRGNLSKIEFAKLLAWLNEHKSSGTLRITRGDKSKFIIIESGEVTSAYSEFSEDSFKSVIKRLQLLPESQQLDLELEKGETDGRFAKRLIEKGYVTEREFIEVFKKQNQDIILSLFEWRQGEFIFYEEKFPENKSVTLKLPFKWIIEKGVERSRLRREADLKVPQEAIFKVVDTNFRRLQTAENASFDVRTCFNAIEEPCSIRDLVRLTGLTEFSVVQFLFSFIQLNQIQPIFTEKTQLSDEIGKKLAEAEILYSKARYWDAWMRMKKIVEETPTSNELQEIYRQYSEKFKDDLKDVIQSTELIPKIGAKLDENIYTKFPKDTALGFILSRIDGNSSIKDLGRLLQIDKDKVLITVYLLVKGGIVKLEAKKEIEPEDIVRRRRSVRQVFERMHQQTYYEMLGVAIDSDDATIKNAYFRLAKLYHPDARDANEPEDIVDKMEQIFVKIRDAYQTLSDSQKRTAYNLQIGIDQSSKEATEILKTRTKAQLQFSVGLKSLLSREYRNAMEFFRSAIDLDPFEPRYYAKLAEVCTKNPRWYRAGILACRKASQLDPENNTYYSILGTLYKLDGNFVEAEQQFKKVLLLDPENLTARQELGSMGKTMPKEAAEPRKDTQFTPMLRTDKKEEKK